MGRQGSLPGGEGQACPWWRATEARIFLTCWLVYAAFWNPWLASSMTWNFLDAAVSFVDTGRWEMAHPYLYDWRDTATVRGKLVSAEPPGMPALLLPLYLMWRLLVGPVDTAGAFQAFNGFLALALGATASALAAVQVAWLAGWLGATRGGQLWAAALFAFGTQNFVFGTTLFKENFAGLAVVTALRMAVEPGGPGRRATAGAVAGAATALAHPVGLLAPLLFLLVGWREGARRAAAFLAGYTPFAVALGAYNTWLFGRPWRSGYFFVTGLSRLGFARPKPAILLDLLVGPRGGLFLYAPFLLLALVGLVLAWRAHRRGEATVAAVFLAGTWLAAAAWQSQFGVRASWSHSLGPRMMFPAVPLLAAFAGPPLERAGRGAVLLVAVPSVVCGYLSAQAGFIPTANPFPYALKTWVSGTGMGVLFKEALPVWLGLDTLHTMVSRPEVSSTDLLRLLPTHEGLLLARNQALFLGANLAVLGSLAWFLRRSWWHPGHRKDAVCGS